MSDEQTVTAILRELVVRLTSARDDAMRCVNTERPSHESYHRGRASAFDSAIKTLSDALVSKTERIVVENCVGIITFAGDTASTRRETRIGIREQTLCVSG